MSIERFERTSLTTFATWCAAHLVKGGEHAQNYYFKYMEFYSYSGTVFGIDLYRDEPIFTLTDEAPTNWSANYNDYYTNEDGAYIKNDFDSAPEWEAGVYYSRTAPTEKALRIGKEPANSQYFRIQPFKSASSSEAWASTSVNFPTSIVIFKCDGGVLIRFAVSSTYVADLIIAKTNNGETACIFNGITGSSNPTQAMYMTEVYAVTWGDSSGSKKLTFNAQEQFQTQLVPFTTYAQYESISYTPTAFYCPISSVYALRNHTVTYNGKYYVTNGYWMIADELPDIPSAESA